MVSLFEKKLLYIEDDPESRNLMDDILQLHGYKFLGASRGLEGIRIAKDEAPDLILIDLSLPDMDGYEVTTLLKSIKSLEKTPIIALTGDASLDARERTIAAGCNGFISKPINVTEFIILIEEYLEGKKEKLTSENEKKFLSEYNIRLVEKLQNKIEELEKLNINLTSINEESNEAKDRLTDYNNRLFYMNNLANLLRIQNSPQDVLRLLPQKLIEGFHIDRCIIFEYSEETQALNTRYSSGLTENSIKKLKLKLDRKFYRQLKEDYKIEWVKNKDEIIDGSLYKIAQNLNSLSFILGSISGFRSRKDAASILQSIVSTNIDNASVDLEFAISDKLLIFLDRGKSQEPFETYEVRILKSFLQTASIIYENMLLYHKLMKFYRIRELEAITDALTNVFNYRYFHTQIEREMVRSDRHNKSFSIAMLDIDNFKQYNDAHGHLNGDSTLQLVAKRLVENIRKSDIVARYGGDEFVIIFPELEKTKARDLAQKLCAVIKKTKIPKKRLAPKISLTISLGIATYPDDGKTETILLKKADDALYKAKTQGRDTVCIST